MFYVTYKLNNVLKRGCLSEKQYNHYLKDTQIVDLQIHGSQHLMENYFNQSTGNNTQKTKTILLG